MEVVAKGKNIKVSPQKARIPADIVRGMMAVDALGTLKYMKKKAAADVYKVLDSAVANARNNHSLDIENLVVSKVLVNEGRKLRRFKPGSRGNVLPIKRRYSHIEITVRDINEMVQELGAEKTTKKTDKPKAKEASVKKTDKKETKKADKPKTAEKKAATQPTSKADKPKATKKPAAKKTAAKKPKASKKEA